MILLKGFACGHLDSEIVALGNPGDSITPGQFTGEDAPPASYFDGLIRAIGRKWLDDGKSNRKVTNLTPKCQRPCVNLRL